MTIAKKTHADRTFYDILLDDSMQYTVIKSSINGAAVEWMAVKRPYENITSTELGQSLIAYCQENP